ncbi:aspartate aminotransferase [Fusarium solani]|uniref:Aspartate aminotransferase n=1 Tax=Fusarium solani TaxID=169388 RepID=A0A9P9G7A9_FUSSL|nr:aspartate aminotransferase [Fusarium solani]KAH7232492.1 aspartate aminotransferase [Fusarium solani]
MPSTNVPIKPSQFSDLEPTPLDGPFALDAAYRKDTHEKKVNLGIGAYRDDQGQPWVLSAVKEAKQKLTSSAGWLHEYLPPQGDEDFLQSAKAVLFGRSLSSSDESAIASVQTVSGTGANSLAARFAGRYIRPGQIWLPDPTWINHFKIWSENAPDVPQRQYPYYNPATLSFDFDGMVDKLRREAVAGDAVLLHACAHNPTGLDPTQQQWRDIAALCEEKQLFAIFDVAYQGFASGNLDSDAWAVQHFLTSCPNLEFAACQSFSKNFGLYGERLGVLHFVTSRHLEASTAALAVRSRLVALQRSDISTTPRFGSDVAGLVLSSSDLFAMWLNDLEVMTGRLKGMRIALYAELVRLGTPGDWTHLIKQRGMFCYTGLTKKHAAVLRSQYHVYMLDTGRLSVCGLTTDNVKYVAKSIHQAVLCTETEAL